MYQILSVTTVVKVIQNRCNVYTGFSIKYNRLIKYEIKSIFSIIFPSFLSMSRSGIFFGFEKRASFLGNPVDIHKIL